MLEAKGYLPLFDADILAYECCYAGQYYDDEAGELKILSFRNVEDKIKERVQEILDALADKFGGRVLSPPVMYLTGPDNFREEVAIRKGYKANRDHSKRPYHLENARVYIQYTYPTYISRGCEADDLICISQTEYNRRFRAGESEVLSVVCTRDKDLRQVEGWHYGWESGQQPEFKPQWVDYIGEIHAKYKEGVSPKTGKPTKRFEKLSGTGRKWFYAQLLTGDDTDNIPGLKGVGGAKAYTLLDPVESEDEMLELVVAEYQRVYADTWKTELYEQAHLVYMLLERNEDGTVKFWQHPEDADGS